MFYPVETDMTLSAGDVVAARCTMVNTRDRWWYFMFGKIEVISFIFMFSITKKVHLATTFCFLTQPNSALSQKSVLMQQVLWKPFLLWNREKFLIEVSFTGQQWLGRRGRTRCVTFTWCTGWRARTPFSQTPASQGGKDGNGWMHHHDGNIS